MTWNCIVLQWTVEGEICQENAEFRKQPEWCLDGKTADFSGNTVEPNENSEPLQEKTLELTGKSFQKI